MITQKTMRFSFSFHPLINHLLFALTLIRFNSTLFVEIVVQVLTIFIENGGVGDGAISGTYSFWCCS